MIWIAIFVVVVIFFYSIRSKKKQVLAQSGLVLIGDWLRSNKIKYETVSFSSYRDGRLSSVPGGTILVGMGDREAGGSAGFVVDLTPGGVIHDAAVIHPGAASYHKTAAMESRLSNKSFMSLMLERSWDALKKDPRPL